MKAGSGANLVLKREAYWYRQRVPADLVDSLGAEIIGGGLAPAFGLMPSPSTCRNQLEPRHREHSGAVDVRVPVGSAPPFPA